MPESMDWPRLQPPPRRHRRRFFLIVAVIAGIFFGGLNAGAITAA
jgi:membrane-anchored glycerophosphoryl diester phosphodiesterase (GDPDase)